MIKKNISGAAMPAKEDKISNNPMKLYAYLVCIAGPCDEYCRLFQQKDLILTRIKESTGITDKTVKNYIYQLEKNHMIKYTGNIQFIFIDETKDEYKNNRMKLSKDISSHAAEIWKKRNKEEKSAYYRIPVPSAFTKIPEVTLEKLNCDYGVSELEMKLYLLCCHYRDFCAEYRKSYKALTYENIRDCFNLSNDNKNNVAIRKALYFLRGIGLIDFSEGFYLNSKGAKIPSFKIVEVNYYVIFKFEEMKKEDFIEQNDWEILKERFNSFNLIS